MLTAEQIESFTQNVKRRSVPAMERCIGKEKTIRLNSKITVTGVIVECSFHGVRVLSKSVVAQFKIVMECGVNKKRRDFICEKLPR